LTAPHPKQSVRGPAAKVLALSAPRPDYPYEARRAKITGEGVAVLTVDRSSGSVISVAMERSTGNAALDQAAIRGFSRWRFRPGTPATVRCPITYTLTGAIL
jgi:TonB family protein